MSCWSSSTSPSSPNGCASRWTRHRMRCSTTSRAAAAASAASPWASAACSGTTRWAQFAPCLRCRSRPTASSIPTVRAMFSMAPMSILISPIAGKEEMYFTGGKGANQAVSAAKQGVLTTLIGRLGADAFGRELRTFLAAQSIDLGSVQDTADAHTGTAIITVANSDNTIVVISGANALVSAADVAAASLAKGDVAVSQFEIPLPAIAAFFQRARAIGVTTILNPAPARAVGPELLALVDVLVLNETE